MFYSGLCWLYPLIIVWVIGFFLAISSWQRHPHVSAAVLISITCMLSAVVGQQLIFAWLLPGGSMADVAIYLQITFVIGSLIRAAGWAAILVAIFGWRKATDAGHRNSLQFRIRGLLIVTLLVAVLCGVLRAIVHVLGEQAAVLLNLIDEIPIAICWLFGGWLAWTRRKLHPEVSWRVLLAIGLQVGSLIVNIALIVWIVSSDALNLFSPILLLLGLFIGPVSWVLLLMAAFGWRTTPANTDGGPLCESLA